MKTEPFDIEKAKAGRKVVTREGRDVEILSYVGRGDYLIKGYVGEMDVIHDSWLEDGKFCKGEDHDFDLLLVSLEFPDPPAGHVWHNPLGLNPEQVGEKYRLALVGEEVIEGQAYEYLVHAELDFTAGSGWGIVGVWNDDIAVRLPKDTPFNIPTPAKPSLDQLIELVKQWGIEKGITGPDGKATLLKQLEKTQEELIETRDAVLLMQAAEAYGDEGSEVNQRNKALDGYGDQLVTIILGLEMLNSSVPEALQMAYDVISKRTGTVKNGVFIKDA